MPAFLGWWIYIVVVPLCGGALLTLFSLGGRGRKAAHRGPGHHAHHTGHHHHHGASKHVKAAPTKPHSRQTRAAELPPLFLAQNFLLIWSFVALAASPFHPQNATLPVLLTVFGGIAILSIGLLGVCAQLFTRLTPTDASSITHKSDLQGRIGECDATTDAKRGSLLVRDEYGTLHHMAARSDEPIVRGEAVLLIEYHPQGDYFQVRSWKD